MQIYGSFTASICVSSSTYATAGVHRTPDHVEQFQGSLCAKQCNNATMQQSINHSINQIESVTKG